MTIPVLWMALSFAAGIILENFFRPSFIILASLFLLLLPLVWIARGHRSFIPLAVSLFIVLGLAYAAEDKFRPSHAIEIWAGPDRVNLEGVVTSPPDRPPVSGKEP